MYFIILVNQALHIKLLSYPFKASYNNHNNFKWIGYLERDNYPVIPVNHVKRVLDLLFNNVCLEKE